MNQGTPKQDFFTKVRAHRLTTTFTLLTTLTVGVMAGSVMTRDVSGKEQQKVDSSDARPIVIPNPVTLSNGFSQIVKQVGPAVVNINTESLPKQALKKPGRGLQRPMPNPHGDQDGQGGNQGDMQDFFNKFFGGQNPGGGGGDDDDAGGGERRALGSGYIVDPRGYIITNNHVVDKADKIFVKLAGDSDSADPGYAARVIGVDTETDIAVIKIDAKEPLPTVGLGNSDGAQVGDWVLAIGSPFGLSQTVSAGIVSAKNRSIDERDAQGLSKQFQRFIQTDAAINPGNSGGPLVDMGGKVIGMNTAIYTQSAGSEGVGFAMPSNIVAKVYNDLISPEHKVIRGSIGIQFQAAQSSAVNRVYGFTSGGVIVGSVTKGGGAEKAGLKPGDILVSIDGRQIKDGDDLVADISARKVGTNVQIGYLRDSKPEKHTASVTIGDRAKVYAALAGAGTEDESAPEESDAGQTKLGITVTALPAPVAQKLGIQGGVTVSNVTPGSFADEIGLAKGTLIVEINKQPVVDDASYRAVVSRLKTGDDVVFVVRDPRASRSSGNSFLGGTLR
nr:trypsin-like peptidase domain-containing protein [Granulicella tundricola]